MLKIIKQFHFEWFPEVRTQCWIMEMIW